MGGAAEKGITEIMAGWPIGGDCSVFQGIYRMNNQMHGYNLSYDHLPGSGLKEGLMQRFVKKCFAKEGWLVVVAGVDGRSIAVIEAHG